MLKSILVALFLFFTSVTSAQTMKLYNRLELVMDKAEQGDPQAQFNVGVIYNLGWNTPVDNQKALYWFKKAAEQGHTSSIYNIGVFYLNGFGVDVNYVEAAKWLEQAVNKGHFNALINLHWIYAEGHLPRDDEKLFQLEEKAFVNATAEERFVLANSYFSDMYQPRERGVYWLYKAVELGHIKAKLQLASLYVNGEFVEKDFKKAFSLSQDVAETGDPDGQYLLGGLFQLGLGTEKNQVIAVKWFRKAAEQGLADAEYSLGLCYLKGWGVEKDLTQSFDWFLKSAEKGVVKGQVDVARAYLLGIGVQKDHNKAKYWLEKAALAGDVNAQFMLGGLLYEKSKKKGQAQHRDRGLELTILAAEQGLRDAQYNLGIYYKTLKQNTKAIYWFEKAAIQGDVFAFAKLAEMYPKKEQAKRLAAVAEQGDPQSAYSLSMMYRSKRFGKKNDKEMQKWLLNAAARGHQAAQVELGLRYLGGNIFPKDIEKGIFWLEKSAEEDIQIQLELAERYFKGNDVPKNIERSYYWLENAAKQGSAEAQFILAHFYLNGVGGQTDNQKAKMWFEYALENGIDEANVYLAELDTEGRYANFDYTPYAEKGNVDAQLRLAILKHKQEQYKEAVKWLEKLEKRGEPYAKFLLGLYYFNGIELKQDTQKALALLKEAAEADLAEAQLVLFELYDYGVKEVGTQQQAKAWLDKAVQQGFIPAIRSMALYYKKQSELKSALETLEKAAQLNDLEAQRELISFYLQPEVQDYKKAFDWAEKVAEQGDEFALITLATYYAKGIGVQADLAKAETILAPLVQKEDLFAKYALGLIRMEQQKIEEAIALIEPLAKIEFADAQFQLGRIYLDKRFSVQNDSLAYRWLLKAAEHHHPEAQYMLFAMYSGGVAVPQDNEKANYWLDRAIAQGEPKALFFKAQQQLKEQNTEQAVKLLQNAANQGIDMAKVTLGILYMQGRGVEKNLSQAEFWFNQISNERKGQIIDQLFFPYEHKKIQADWKDQ